MKELFVVQVCPTPEGGGAELLVRKLASDLKNYGINSKAIYLSNPGNIDLHNNEYCLGFNSPRDLRVPFKLRAFLKSILPRNDSDVVVHGHLTWALYYLAFALLPKKIKLVYTEHSTYNKRRKIPALRYIETHIYRRYEKIICISEPTTSSLRGWLTDKGVENNVVTINNGSRQFAFKQRHIKNNKLNILMICSHVGKKGFDHAVEAIAKAKDVVAGFRVLGNPLASQDIHKELARTGIESLSKFVGWVDDIESEYHHADVLLMPSRWEGFGLTAVEAMSTGLPVIASNVPGLSDVVDKSSGYTVDVGDIDGISKALYHLSSDHEHYVAMSNAATLRAKKFKIEDMYAQYVEQYKVLTS